MSRMKFAGVELYFEDLPRARSFYSEVLGLTIAEDQPGHHARFDSPRGFLCLERKGIEKYPSADKAVIFLEVPDLASEVARIGADRFVRIETRWAVLHDPEGHNILILQGSEHPGSPPASI